MLGYITCLFRGHEWNEHECLRCGLPWEGEYDPDTIIPLEGDVPQEDPNDPAV